VTTEVSQTMDLAKAEARLPRWMAGCGIAAAAFILAFGQVRLAAGFALGAFLAVLGYYWLHEVIETLMSAGQVRIPRRVIAKLLVRYPLMFGVVFLFYKTGWLPMTAILGGLFVPAAGVTIEGAVQAAQSFRQP
jgi:hypothetical protein